MHYTELLGDQSKRIRSIVLYTDVTDLPYDIVQLVSSPSAVILYGALFLPKQTLRRKYVLCYNHVKHCLKSRLFLNIK